MRWITIALLTAACGSTQVKVEPVQIEPIHIVVDVNLHQAK
jgi:hypothetical protein